MRLVPVPQRYVNYDRVTLTARTHVFLRISLQNKKFRKTILAGSYGAHVQFFDQ